MNSAAKRGGGWWRAAVAAVVVVPLAWFSVGRGLADQALRGGAAELALTFRPSSPDANALLAEARLEAGDVQGAAALATEALREAPASVRALRVLALAEEKQGNHEAAAALMSRSAGWGWRDTPTHLWLYQRTMLAGNYVAAMQHADALLRRGRSAETVTPILIASTMIPEARAALIVRLVDRPGWRTPVLRELGARSQEVLPGAESLFRELAASEAPPRAEEVAPFLWRLMANGRYRQARTLWRDLFAADGAPLLIDGGFADADLGKRPQYATPFEWRPATGGATGYAEIATPPVPFGGRALLIEQDGGGAAAFIEQTLVLQPGAYVASAVIQADSPATVQRIGITVRCEGNGTIATGEERDAPARRNWRRIELPIVVPADGCEAQTIGVATGAGERRDRLSAWIDNVTVRPGR